MESYYSEPSSKGLAIDPQLLKKGVIVLRALDHDLRLKMLQLIHHHTSLTVTELYTKLKIEQSVASQHLAVLRHARFVVFQRSGKKIFYAVNYKYLAHVQQKVREIIGKS